MKNFLKMLLIGKGHIFLINKRVIMIEKVLRLKKKKKPLGKVGKTQVSPQKRK